MDVFPVTAPPLAEHHRRLLNAAAITDDIIDKLEISSNEALDHIVFPWTDGKNTVYVRRPDDPTKLSQKYIWPNANPLILWFTRPAMGDTYLLVEGVKQTLAVTSWAPVQFGVVGMNGCWGWRKTDLTWAQEKDIVVFLDGDRQVNEDVAKAADALTRTLTKYGVNTVTFATIPLRGVSGIDDILSETKPQDRTSLLQGYVDSAQFTGRRLVIKSALDYAPKRRRWLFKDFIPEGVLCLLSGYEGTAKSTVTTDIVAQITRGELVGDSFGIPRHVIYITQEEDWDYDIVPRLIASGANLASVHNVFIEHHTGSELALSLQQDLAEIRRTIVENDISLIVFDSLLYFMAEGINVDKSSPVNDILLPLVKVGMETRCTMLGILHFNKNTNLTSALDKVANSKAFTRIARSIIMTAQHEEHFIFSVEKLNVAAKPKPRKFRLESVQLPMEYDDDEGPIMSVRVEWLGESEVDVAEIINLKMRGEDPSTREVDEWLKEYMDQSGGYVLGSEVTVTGKKEFNFSADMIKRAKRRLGIMHKREGFGANSRMYWMYRPAELEQLKERMRGEIVI